MAGIECVVGGERRVVSVVDREAKRAGDA